MAVRATTTAPLDEPRRRFVDDVGGLHARYGRAPAFGRVLALLLMSDEPLGLDDLAAQLGIGKTSAHSAARQLETVGMVRRLATPGSRRVRYELIDDADPIFQAQAQVIRESLAVVERAEALARGPRARRRMAAMREAHEAWLSGSEEIRRRWEQRLRRRMR